MTDQLRREIAGKHNDFRGWSAERTEGLLCDDYPGARGMPVRRNTGCLRRGHIEISALRTAMHEAISSLTSAIRAAGRAVVFTGAGISTESGIPDFRSPGGMWSRMPPIEFQDFLHSEEMRRETWRRKLVTDRTMRAARPNRGHEAVAQLVKRGVCSCVITQNVDGLHQLSGVPQDKVIELHGNSTYAACLTCGLRHELDLILTAFEQDGILPLCRDCGGTVKTATISFGQRMPLAAVERAEQEALACDLFIVLGSSLVVFPAADLPRLAKRNGAKLVIVNREATDQDGSADLVIHDEIGPTLGAAVAALAPVHR